MDSETAKNAHPGFVEIIRNLSADEAKVLTFLFAKGIAPIIDIHRKEKTGNSGFNLHKLVSTIGSDSGCEHRDLMGSYLINIERLGLIELDKGTFLRERGIWQRRYWEHQIRDDLDLTRHVDYIHISPVKHGHVHVAANWPHSSIHRYIRAGILPKTWAGNGVQSAARFGELE